MPITVTITADTTATDIHADEHPLRAGTYDVLKATDTLLIIEDGVWDGRLWVEVANPAVDFRLAAYAVFSDSAIYPMKTVELVTAADVDAGGDTFMPSDDRDQVLARLGYKTVGESRTHRGSCGCVEFDVVPTDFRV